MQSEVDPIHYKKYHPQKCAYIRASVASRSEIQTHINTLLEVIPSEYISNNVICTYNYLTNIEHGFDVEIAVPINPHFISKEINTKILAEYECFTLIHTGSLNTLNLSTKKLFAHAYSHGINSDEFSREIFITNNKADESPLEIQFIIHNWEQKFLHHLVQTIGKEPSNPILRERDKISLDLNLPSRYEWIKKQIHALKQITTEEQRYEILSKCAHVFPIDLLNDLKVVYEQIRKNFHNPLHAIDAFLEYMQGTKCWANSPKRVGNVLYATKLPRDPEAFEKALTPAEKVAAYCFCPLLRNSYNQGMDPEYCKCSAGWFRQQWEIIFGQPIKVEIVQSLLKGDEKCQFAIQIPENL